MLHLKIRKCLFRIRLKYGKYGINGKKLPAYAVISPKKKRIKKCAKKQNADKYPPCRSQNFRGQDRRHIGRHTYDSKKQRGKRCRQNDFNSIHRHADSCFQKCNRHPQQEKCGKPQKKSTRKIIKKRRQCKNPGAISQLIFLRSESGIPGHNRLHQKYERDISHRAQQRQKNFFHPIRLQHHFHPICSSQKLSFHAHIRRHHHTMSSGQK